jgi:hypothetical protein
MNRNKKYGYFVGFKQVTFCPIRKNWSRETCFHSLWRSVRHDLHEPYDSYLKETETCRVRIGSGEITALKIATVNRHHPNRLRGCNTWMTQR